MVQARGRVELAERRRTRYNVAIIATQIMNLFAKNRRRVDDVYKRMEVKDESTDRPIRTYSGSAAQQLEAHKRWLLTDEAKAYRDAGNH